MGGARYFKTIDNAWLLYGNGDSVDKLAADWNSYKAIFIDINGTCIPWLCSAEWYDFKEMSENFRNGMPCLIKNAAYTNKDVVLNSDSHTTDNINTLTGLKGLDDYIAFNAGRDYPRFISKRKEGENRPYALKHFEILAQRLGHSMDECLLIADGATDYETAEHFGYNYFDLPMLLEKHEGIRDQVFHNLLRRVGFYEKYAPAPYYDSAFMQNIRN